MSKKPSPKMRPDVAETAFRVMQEAIGDAPKTDPENREKNPDAMKRGAKGGERGGKARAEKLTPKERFNIAKKAADTRWKDKD